MDRTTLGWNLKPLEDQGLVKILQRKDLRLRMVTLLAESATVLTFSEQPWWAAIRYKAYLGAFWAVGRLAVLP